nr:MAG TPA: hypothetical protein [Caudoviricetes sp.]
MFRRILRPGRCALIRPIVAQLGLWNKSYVECNFNCSRSNELASLRHWIARIEISLDKRSYGF